MATKKVSPMGIGRGIRMVQYFINRAGKNLLAARRRELEKAKKLMQGHLFLSGTSGTPGQLSHRRLA